MSKYCPNFYDTFLTRYCRDGLACTLPCQNLSTCARSNVPAVYPHVNAALARVAHNDKQRNFNCAYQSLVAYLKAYPKAVHKINAILTQWAERKHSKKEHFTCDPIRVCKCKHSHDHYSAITNPGNRECGGCAKCPVGKGEAYHGYKPCGSCGYQNQKNNHGSNCDQCHQSLVPRYSNLKKKCYGGCTYRDHCVCGTEALHCEPRCDKPVKSVVPYTVDYCTDHCSRSLKSSLSDVVPHCLKYDTKLQWLIADVVRFCL